MQNTPLVLKPGKLKSGELSRAHSPQDLRKPILSQTPDPKHIVWLTQEQLAVSGH